MSTAKHFINVDGQVTEQDDRTVEACAAFQVAMLKEACQRAILADVPDYKQRNAALGLLSEQEEAFVRAAITLCRNRCAALEAQVAAIAADHGLTRTQACDAIQAVLWT